MYIDLLLLRTKAIVKVMIKERKKVSMKEKNLDMMMVIRKDTKKDVAVVSEMELWRALS